MARVRIDVTKNDLPKVAAHLRPYAVEGVHTWGFRVQGKAQSRAKVDTGHMRSTTTTAPNASGVEVKAPAAYSGFLDMGTRSIPADHWFSGAVDEEKAQLNKDVAAAIKRAVG